MKVEIKRMNKAFHLEATCSDQQVLNMDCAPEIGGEGKGIRPMELLLAAAGGCVSIDLGLILQRQRQVLDDYAVEVSGERSTEKSKHLSSLHLNFRLFGNLDADKVEKAIELSLEKYCSVILSLSSNVSITYAYTINGEKHEK